MDDVLLHIGSVVEVEVNEEKQIYLIAGKRIINYNSMKSWDYYAVPAKVGLIKDRQGNDENGFYFNHTDICKVIDQQVYE